MWAVRDGALGEAERESLRTIHSSYQTPRHNFNRIFQTGCVAIETFVFLSKRARRSPKLSLVNS